MGKITATFCAYLVFIVGLNVWKFGLPRLQSTEFLYNFQYDVMWACTSWLGVYLIIVFATAFKRKTTPAKPRQHLTD
jgi:hypothetical protein